MLPHRGSATLHRRGRSSHTMDRGETRPWRVRHRPLRSNPRPGGGIFRRVGAGMCEPRRSAGKSQLPPRCLPIIQDPRTEGADRRRHALQFARCHPDALNCDLKRYFANIHLDRFDHFLKQELRVTGYVRYVDDFILFGPDRSTLHHWGRQCRESLAARRMEIHPEKYRLCRTAEGVDFCGFVVRADERVRRRSSGVRRFRRRLLKLKHEWKAGRAEAADVRDAVRFRVAHRQPRPRTRTITWASLPGDGVASHGFICRHRSCHWRRFSPGVPVRDPGFCRR